MNQSLNQLTSQLIDKLVNFQYYDIIILLIILILILRYASKTYIRNLLLRIVLQIDVYQESATGQQKLKLARQAFLLTLSKRFHFLSIALDFLIPEAMFNKMVDNTLNSIQDILKQNQANTKSKVEVITNEIAETLKAQHVNGDYNVTDNEQIDREINSIRQTVEDKQGYAKLYAKYNEKDKTSIGAEVGIKF